VTKIIVAREITENDLLAAAASAEQQSEHPLASAIVEAARERNVSPENVEDFSSTTGGGVIREKRRRPNYCRPARVPFVRTG